MEIVAVSMVGFSLDNLVFLNILKKWLELYYFILILILPPLFPPFFGWFSHNFDTVWYSVLFSRFEENICLSAITIPWFDDIRMILILFRQVIKKLKISLKRICVIFYNSKLNSPPPNQNPVFTSFKIYNLSHTKGIIPPSEIQSNTTNILSLLRYSLWYRRRG